MEGEIMNFMVVWISVLASLCYCYTIGKIITKGTTRLFIIFPVICLFFILPLNLSTIHLGGTTAFFITWLATFKLLLFANDHGPLSSDPPLSLPKFILLACLPIKIQHHPSSQKLEKPQTIENKTYPSPQITKKSHKSPLNYAIKDHKSYPSTQITENDHKSPLNYAIKSQKSYPSPQITKKGHKSPLNYAIKGLLLAIFVPIYDYKQHVHPNVILLLYCAHIYVGLEFMLAMIAVMVRAFLRLEVEPQFDEPYLSTSLQDFWGRRWNLMVTSILRPTVYNPVRSVSSRWIDREWAVIPAILATFTVSALMHELIFFYLGRVKPTWEVSCFFLLHGVCLAAEIVIKKALDGKLRVPPVVTRPLAIGFVVITAFWLFFPPLLRCDAEARVRSECIAVIEFVRVFFKSLDSDLSM